jgi:Cu-processing system permease protein
MDPRNVLLLARKELRDALRNRWVLLYTLCFTVLTVLLAKVSMASGQGAGAADTSNFGRTTAGMINLVVLFVPLMALLSGAASLASERERGTLACLLAQPVYRLEVLLGKFLGLWAALTLILLLSFAVTLAFLGSSTAALGPFLRLLAYTDLLAGAMLSVGLLISTLCQRTSIATGVALFVWLALVFLTDLGLMGSVMIFHLRIQSLFYLTVANPMQAFKMAVLGSIHTSLDVLGPAGLFAARTYGPWLAWLFGGALLAWILLPLGAAWAIFARRGEA